MSAGPAIVALLTSIPLGLLTRRFSAKRGVVIAAFLARTMLLAYVLIPSVVPAPDRIHALLAITLLVAFPNTLLGICFGPVFLGWSGFKSGHKYAGAEQEGGSVKRTRCS